MNIPEKTVEEAPDLLRQGTSGAIMNTNVQSFHAAKKAKQANINREKRIQILEEKVDRIDGKLDLILELFEGK